MAIKIRKNVKLSFAKNGVHRLNTDNFGLDEKLDNRHGNGKKNQVDYDMGRKLFGMILSE